MSEILTEEFILNKTKNKELSEIKNFNIWGSDLEDISIIIRCYNLEVATFSANKIKTLQHFSFLPKLTELYLRKNNISDVNEIKYLKVCSLLKILWLDENPISTMPNYRKFVVKELTQLQKLDNIVILPHERDDTENTIKTNSKNSKINNGLRVVEGTYVNNIIKLSTVSSFKNYEKKNNSIISVKSTAFVNLNSREKETMAENSREFLKRNQDSFQPQRINYISKDSLDFQNNFNSQSENFKSHISNKNIFIVNAIKNLLEELNFNQLGYIKTIIEKKLSKIK
jgi:hypothetical protein